MFSAIRSALAAALLTLPLIAQIPTADPQIEPEILTLQLRPLQKDQVTQVADAWQALLAAKNLEISQLEIDLRKPATPEAAQQRTRLAAAREEQARLVTRINTVLLALRARGGETEAYDKYVAASTGVTIDATDVTGTLQLVRDWVMSKEGGIKLGLNVLKFLATLLAFRVLAAVLSGLARRTMARMKRTTELLRDFFVNTVRKLTSLIGVIVAVEQLGIDIGPFIAAIGAAGFVIGFALQGTLSNFAAGIMILIYRPYDIGEVVTVAGTTGKVDEMTLVSTTLRLPDNQTVVVPNNSIWGDVITNITGQTTRRVDMVFGCSYGDDLQKVQTLLEQIVKQHPKVLAEPEPVVKVHQLADSSVNFVVRPWANTADYWDVFWDVTRTVKQRFDEEGISIPFPQRDVHVHQATA
ncbi:MAG: mechanosensitive ion channel family protein [Planctomycetota bacterium]